MNLGELLRIYAPHIWQAHLEWAETAEVDYADAFTDILSPAEQAAAEGCWISF